MLLANQTVAAEMDAAAGLLKRADSIKTSNYSEFARILTGLRDRGANLSLQEQQFLRYLEGWQTAYEGDYEGAIPVLNAIAEESRDITLKFRARATLVNVLSIAKDYEAAFSQLNHLLELLPNISDGDAREQGLGVTAVLYNQVGQYDLGLRYAQQLVEEDWGGRGACKGAELKLEVLYKRIKAATIAPEFEKGIHACVRLGDPVRANLIRTYLARLYMNQGRFEDAVELLKRHRDETRRTRYPLVISEFDALLARAYRELGEAALVREYALSAVEAAVKNQYTEPVVTANRLLYLLAREQGNFRSALSFHEKYAAADKGYLDDVSARQLAYERVRHEGIAKTLQIDSLNKQNEVLQLQQALDKKAVEASRLYIALLIMLLAFIALWAYRTKRSQMHFMKLSRIDGLTGIANRPHFIQLAASALENGRKAQQELCIVLCDLDHFKSINDKHGHASGDEVLKQTVAACQAHLRASDIFGRFGGEEFGIVLPGCGLEAARERSEQLRIAISAIVTDPNDAESHVTASFGIACTTASGYDLRQLLAHADAALYEAKHAGRNCVVPYEGKPFNGGPRFPGEPILGRT